jgi:hypothetical protein
MGDGSVAAERAHGVPVVGIHARANTGGRTPLPGYAQGELPAAPRLIRSRGCATMEDAMPAKTDTMPAKTKDTRDR